MKKLWQRLLDTPSTDPDDARRRRLLNVILIGLAATCCVGLIFYVYVALTEDLRIADPGYRTLFALLGFSGTIALAYWAGRRWSSMAGGSVLLVLFTVLITFRTYPKNI